MSIAKDVTSTGVTLECIFSVWSFLACPVTPGVKENCLGEIRVHVPRLNTTAVWFEEMTPIFSSFKRDRLKRENSAAVLLVDWKCLPHIVYNRCFFLVADLLRAGWTCAHFSLTRLDGCSHSLHFPHLAPFLHHFRICLSTGSNGLKHHRLGCFFGERPPTTGMRRWSVDPPAPAGSLARSRQENAGVGDPGVSPLTGTGGQGLSSLPVPRVSPAVFQKAVDQPQRN